MCAYRVGECYSSSDSASRRTNKRVRELWWVGLPPGVRGKVWRKAIGNDLNISPGEHKLKPGHSVRLFCLFQNRAVPNLPYSVSRETGIHEETF